MNPESLFSLSEHLDRLSEDGDPLEVLDATVDFDYFRGWLVEGLGYGDGSKGGRPPFDPVSMFKVLIVQTQHNLSDARMEFMIRDRLSWMRFFGFELGGRMPDENTIRHFRNRLTETGTLKRVMQAFDWQLHKKGYQPVGFDVSSLIIDNCVMSNFIDYSKDQLFLLPPSLNDGVSDDDLAHFILEAVEHVDMSAFHISRTGSGKAQYHPRMMLALLIYCYATGIFSSRKIEQASYRHVSVRFIAANTHPDHDTIATFRRRNCSAFSAAFEHILLLASQSGLLKVGTVSVDGTKIKANASKIKSIRYDRIQILRKRLAKDIADLMDKAEAADNAPDDDGTRLPKELSRRKTLKAKLDEAAKRLEEEADANHDDESAPLAVKADEQINLTDPDSAIMRKSVRHEYQQAYNAQAAVDADATMLVVATDVLSTPNDRAGIEALLDEMEKGGRCPDTLVADAGYAGEAVVNTITERGIEPLISVQRAFKQRPYDFRPCPERDKPPRSITTPWRREMIEKLKSDPAKAAYKKRKQSVEPVFGIIKSAIGFTQFHLRGIENVKAEWKLITLAYNCKRMVAMAG